MRSFADSSNEESDVYLNSVCVLVTEIPDLMKLNQIISQRGKMWSMSCNSSFLEPLT